MNISRQPVTTVVAWTPFSLMADVLAYAAAQHPQNPVSGTASSSGRPGSQLKGLISQNQQGLLNQDLIMMDQLFWKKEQYHCQNAGVTIFVCFTQSQEFIND